MRTQTITVQAPTSRCLLLALALLFTVIILGGCGPQMGPGPGTTPPGRADQSQGLLALFLRLEQAQCPPCILWLEQVEIMDRQGRWIRLEAPAKRVDHTLGKGQIFLLRHLLPTGYYSKLRFSGRTVPHPGSPIPADPSGQRQEQAVAWQQREISLAAPLYLGPNDSLSLFLSWDVAGTIADRGLPVFRAAPRLPHLIADLAYATCPEINTLFLLSTGKNRVIDSMGLMGGPSYMAVPATTRGSDNLLVLEPEKRRLARVLPSAARKVETIDLVMMNEPSHLALSEDGSKAFVLDRERGDIFRIDLRSGQTENRVHLGYRPSFLISLPGRNQIAVSLAMSQSVVLLREDDLQPVQTITTGSRPEGLLAWQDRLLYVAESGSGTVLMVDLITNTSQRITVDFNPRRLALARSRIFVTNTGSRSLSLLMPGRMQVSRTIPLPGRPGEVSAIPANAWLYVGDQDNGSILVINPATGQIADRIDLGCRPLGIVPAN